MRVTMPDGFEEEIGAVAVNAAALDHTILMFIGLLISPDQSVGQTVGAQLQFRQRIELLRALYRLLLAQFPQLEPVSKELEAVLSQVEAAGSERNRLMHDLWVPADSSDEHLRLQIKARPGLELRVSRVALVDLRQVREGICAAHEALSKFMVEHHMAVDGEPPKVKVNPMLTRRHTLYEASVRGAIAWEVQFGAARE